jgi:hypothetical protein
MEENTPPNISTIFVFKQESRGSSHFLTTLNKWGCRKEKQNYHRGNQSNDTLLESIYESMGRYMYDNNVCSK